MKRLFVRKAIESLAPTTAAPQSGRKDHGTVSPSPNHAGRVSIILSDEHQPGSVKNVIRGRIVIAVLLVVSVGWVCCGRIEAADESPEEPLLQQEPFDRLTLAPQFGGAVVKIKRLPVRELPSNPKPTDRLQVQLFSEPDKTFEVSWAALAKVELHEQIVLDEARAMTAAGKLDAAYELFRYLEGNHPKLPGLAEAVEDYLFEEAKFSMRQKDYAGALAMLRELHRRNPKRAGLDAAMGVATERAAAEAVAQQRYAAARGLWRSLRECYRDHPKAVAGEEQLRAQAAALLEQAKKAAEADPAAAGRLCRRIDEIWPSLPEARQLAETLHRRWPTVVVGCVRGSSGAALGGGALGNAVSGAVLGGATDPVPATGSQAASSSAETMRWYVDWSSRRDSRLLCRPLCEFVAPGVGGGVYRSAVGTFAADRDNPVWKLTLSADHPALPPAEVIGHWTAAAARVDRNQPGGATAEAVATPMGTTGVALAWPRRLPRPEAAVAAIYRRPFAGESAGISCGSRWRPYLPGKAGSGFDLNPDYFAATATMPRQIVVRTFESSAAAAKALRSGGIAAVDRLSTAEADRLKTDKRFVVGVYRVPLVHAVLVNSRRGPTAQADFRRALAAAIDRVTLLEELGGNSGSTSERRALSGPFPLGIGPDDPLRYAVNPQLPAAKFDPMQAMALLSALERLAAGKPEQPAPTAAAGSEAAARPGGSTESKGADSPAATSPAKEQPAGENATSEGASAAASTDGTQSPASPASNATPAPPTAEPGAGQPAATPDPSAESTAGAKNEQAGTASPPGGSGGPSSEEEDDHYAPPPPSPDEAAPSKASGSTPAAVSAVPRPSARTLPWKLVLAYPPDETAKEAAAQLASQWQWLGLAVELRPLTASTARVPDDCDLLYVVYPVCEPLTDALRLFGRDGLDLPISPLRQWALRRLDEAQSFEQARDALHLLDQVCRDEVALIPLFQSAEHFAARADLKGIDQPALSLYDFIEQWQPAFTWSEF